jgi:hypothetical protein
MVVVGVGAIIVIFGMLTGHQPSCPLSPNSYCLLEPLWYVYRVAVLGGVIALTGIIVLGKGLGIETPW